MYPKITVTPNYFPTQWCDRINAWAMDNITASATLGKKGVRKCDVRLLTPNMHPYDGVLRSMMDFVKSQISNFDVDIDYDVDGPIQHITYKPGHGVGWHDDTLNISAALSQPGYTDLKRDRKLSLTVMLSDPSDYTGGEFVFDRSVKLTNKVEGKGTVALFTSHTPHMVTEVTSGVRNILFIFITGPSWR